MIKKNKTRGNLSQSKILKLYHVYRFLLGYLGLIITMALERRLFLLAVILLHSMNYSNAVKDKKYIQEVSTGKGELIVLEC